MNVKLEVKREELVLRLGMLNGDITDKTKELVSMSQEPGGGRLNPSKADKLTKELKDLKEEHQTLLQELELVENLLRCEKQPKPELSVKGKKAQERIEELGKRHQELSRVQEKELIELSERKVSLGSSVVNGGSPGELVRAIREYELTQEGISAGLEYIREEVSSLTLEVSQERLKVNSGSK